MSPSPALTLLLVDCSAFKGGVKLSRAIRAAAEILPVVQSTGP